MAIERVEQAAHIVVALEHSGPGVRLGDGSGIADEAHPSEVITGCANRVNQLHVGVLGLVHYRREGIGEFAGHQHFQPLLLVGSELAGRDGADPKRSGPIDHERIQLVLRQRDVRSPVDQSLAGL